MKSFTDAELTELLDNIESDRAERKRAWAGDAPEKVRQAVCAFANDLPNYNLPGVVFVGAEDNGAPSGVAIEDVLLRTLADIKTDGKTIPPPTITVEKRTLKGSPMAVMTVWPADSPPVRCEGRIWIRLGPRRGLATAQDERVLSEKRRHRDRHFETHPISACSLTELSRPIFEQEYLPNAFAADVLAANARSYEERLSSCGMVGSADDPAPTVLGLLVLGTAPRSWVAGAYIQFLRIRGTHLSDPVADQAELDGTISAMLRRLDEKLSAHLTVGVDFTSQDREVRRSPYPMAALQQLTRNAVMHRNYEGTNAPVRLHWYDDRIEILNPGGPYGSVTPQNFGRPGFTDYRNPQLAAAFKVLGYAQRFGAGIGVAQAELARNGNPPAEFQVEQNFVNVIIRGATGSSGS